MNTARETELETALAEARALNRVLHRRVQQAESGRPGLSDRGRARLAADCVRGAEANRELTEALGTIRALAAGWGRQTYVPERTWLEALRDIEAEAVKALAKADGTGDLQT